MPVRGKVLVIDDEEAIRKSLRMVLEYEGYECVDAGSGPAGLESLRRDTPDAVLLDIKMPGMDGIEALQSAHEQDPHTPVVMISGHADIPTAVEALRKGAYDFLEKPLDTERVLTAIRNAIERKRLHEENIRLKHEVESRLRLIGESQALRTVQAAIARAAPTQATVLISGESGTGKEVIAWEIHRRSPRAAKSFVRVNCAAIPEELIESELFGHERGAFTGASARQVGKFLQADGGTIFLDEIGDMSARTQAKVLRVLEGGEVEPVGMARTLRVDARVIAATNKDLPAEIRAGRFREDLYFRLNVVPILSPPLRERRDDIPLLVDHFATSFALESNLGPRRFDPDAIEALSALPWRGNVRELKNTVERLLIMSRGDPIGAREIEAGPPDPVVGSSPPPVAAPGSAAAPGTGPTPANAIATVSAVPGPPDPVGFSTLQQFREAAEKSFIVSKLKKYRWNVSRTAKEIDTPRSNLYKKLEQFGISRDEVEE